MKMYDLWADSLWPEDEGLRHRVGRYRSRKLAENARDRMKVLRGTEIVAVEVDAAEARFPDDTE